MRWTASAAWPVLDPGGTAWAASYDKAAAAGLHAGEDVANGCYRLSSMFAQSARNYEAADAASTARLRHAIAAQTATLPSGTAVGLGGRPPSAAGGSGNPPSGWWLIEHTVGYLWPSGHQDRLHAAASAWESAATVLSERADATMLAAIPFGRDRLPEVDDISTVCQAMCGHLRQLAAVYRTLAGACRQLAHHIDEVHLQVEHELVSLGEQTAAIERRWLAGVGVYVGVRAGADASRRGIANRGRRSAGGQVDPRFHDRSPRCGADPHGRRGRSPPSHGKTPRNPQRSSRRCCG